MKINVRFVASETNIMVLPYNPQSNVSSYQEMLKQQINCSCDNFGLDDGDYTCLMQHDCRYSYCTHGDE